MRVLAFVLLAVAICSGSSTLPRSLRSLQPRFAQVRAGCADLTGATFAEISSGNNGQVLKKTKDGKDTALKISGANLAAHDFKVQEELAALTSQPSFSSPGVAFTCKCVDVPADVKAKAKSIAEKKGKAVPAYLDTDDCYFLDQPLLGKDLKVQPPSTEAEKKATVMQIFWAYWRAKTELGFSHSDPNSDNYALSESPAAKETCFCCSPTEMWCVPTGTNIIKIIDYGQSGTTKNPQSKTKVGKQSPMIEKMGLKGMVNQWDQTLGAAISSGNNWKDTLTNAAFNPLKKSACPSTAQCYGPCTA